jgi:hypothetical protein
MAFALTVAAILSRRLIPRQPFSARAADVARMSAATSGKHLKLPVYRSAHAGYLLMYLFSSYAALATFSGSEVSIARI